MANVQIDNGKFTRVANELLLHAARCKFNGTQLRIILVIWRFTYGFQRRDHEFSLTFLAQALNVHKNQIDRELNTLIENRVITVVTDATYTNSRLLRFNKDYNSWLNVGESSKKVTVSGLVENQSSKKVTPPVSGLDDQERKRSFKESIKESSEFMENIPYKQILDYLNLKANKRFTVKSKPTIGFINGRFSEGRTLEDFYHVIDVKVSHWLNHEKWDSYLRPSTLFNATNFENYLNQKMENPNKEQPKNKDQMDLLKQFYQEGAAHEADGNGQAAGSDQNSLPPFRDN